MSSSKTQIFPETKDGVNYHIEIIHDSHKVGAIDATNNGSELRIINANIALSGKGIGTEAIIQLGQYAFNNGLILRSDSFKRMNEASTGLWNKLVSFNLAKRGIDNFVFTTDAFEHKLTTEELFKQDISDFNTFILKSRSNPESSDLASSKFNGRYIFRLGNPGVLLKTLGLPNFQIGIKQDHFYNHIIRDKGHNVKITNFKNLIEEINDPVAILLDKDFKGSVTRYTIITNLKGTNDKPIQIVLQPTSSETIPYNAIITAYAPHDLFQFQKGVLEGNLVYLNKIKLIDYIDSHTKNLSPDKKIAPVALTRNSTNFEKLLYTLDNFKSKNTRYSKNIQNNPVSIFEISQMMQYLSKKVKNTKYQIINDPTERFSGKLSGNTVFINIAYASKIDAWHEFAHPLLITMRYENKELFNSLYNDLKNTEEWSIIYKIAKSKVIALYPEYDFESDDFKEEILATAIGYGANQKEEVTGFFKRIYNKIIDWISKLLDLDSASTIYIKDLNPELSFSDFLELYRDDNYILESNEDLDSLEKNISPNSLLSDIKKFNTKIKEFDPYLQQLLRISEKPYRPRKISKSKKASIYDKLENEISRYRNYGNLRYVTNEVEHKERLYQAYSHQGSPGIRAYENTVGIPIETTSVFIRKLENAINEKTQLDKPFSATDASDTEKRILNEFYSEYLDKIAKFFEEKKKNIPKAIDNSRLLKAYKQWLIEKYPTAYNYTTSEKYTYGIQSAVSNHADLKEGREILISNKFLFAAGHTYKITDELNNITIPGEHNGTGWYIFHELFGDIPLAYEYQSDVVDDIETFTRNLISDESVVSSLYDFVDNIKKKWNHLVEGTYTSNTPDTTFYHFALDEYSILPQLNISDDDDLKFRIENKLKFYYDAVESLERNIAGNISLLNYLNNPNLNKRLVYLRLMSKQVKEGTLSENDFYNSLYTEELDSLKTYDFEVEPFIKGIKKGIENKERISNSTFNSVRKLKKYNLIIYQLKKIQESSLTKELISEKYKLEDERRQATLSLLRAAFYKDAMKNTINEDTLNQLLTPITELISTFSKTEFEIQNQEAIDEVKRQLYSIKSNQLRFFIEHSFIFAKSKGHNKIYLPTASFISKAETGDAWTLYTTPHDQALSSKFKNSHLGSFYEALLEVPDIKFKYVTVKGVDAPLIEVDISNFNKPVERFSKVDYQFVLVDKTLNNISKIQKLYKQLNNDDFWNKIQKDFQIPKNQLALLKEAEGDTIEEKLTSFVANYSYAVEINTAKTFEDTTSIEETEPGLWNFRGDNFYSYSDAINAKNEYNKSREKIPTQYYSYLTVPGGTNYTENEIATQGIAPSIKGHARFSTDNGIGWFRSDDKTQTDFNTEPQFNPETAEWDYIDKVSKTRRILEVQSDWGQKQRKQSDPNMMINFNETKFLQDLQYAGDLKIECD